MSEEQIRARLYMFDQIAQHQRPDGITRLYRFCSVVSRVDLQTKGPFSRLVPLRCPPWIPFGSLCFLSFPINVGHHEDSIQCEYIASYDMEAKRPNVSACN